MSTKDDELNIHAVIMAGGASSRLWPESRTDRPKWLLDFGTGRSLLRQAADRALAAVGSPDRILVITSAQQATLATSVLKDIPARNIISEPELRDTAGCAAYATAIIGNRCRSNPDALIALLPGDQIISPESQFADAVRQAGRLALRDKKIVTVGIVPQSPATGFGYIHRAKPVDSMPGCFAVERFVEKPDIETAKQYVQSGEYYWNAGIFVFRYADIIEQFSNGLPTHADSIRRLAALTEPDASAVFKNAAADAYQSWKKISIDFGVIEGASLRGKIAVVEGNVDWSDVGSWSSVGSHLPTDEKGNSLGADALILNSDGNIVFSRDPKKRVVLLDVSDLFVVDTPDALLIGRKTSDQRVKDIIAGLKAEGRIDLI
ncbi:MAG: sugar phosphate nucleotidyltransferase [Planctomycetota bacterium]